MLLLLWEAATCYPDIDMLPRLAHFFGVSIDTLFGYTDTRTRQIDEVIDRIDTMNRQNNGEDVNLDECIALAREAVLQYPGEERILVALASVLYNAGYVRYGEYHLTDADGYDILDTARHRAYAEWKEAIALYEKALRTIPAGKTRERAIRELAQLYLNTGEADRAVPLWKTRRISTARGICSLPPPRMERHAPPHMGKPYCARYSSRPS